MQVNPQYQKQGRSPKPAIFADISSSDDEKYKSKEKEGEYLWPYNGIKLDNKNEPHEQEQNRGLHVSELHGAKVPVKDGNGEKSNCHFQEDQTWRSSGSPGQSKQHFCQPFVIDPALSGCEIGIGVDLDNCARLYDVQAKTKMPP